MQTKQQIQTLLTSAGLSPNKRRGQHFMIDQNLIRILIDSASIRNNDIVLEVGCGTGTLTEELVPRAGWTVICEIEQPLANITKKQLADAENYEMIVADILENKNTINHEVVNTLRQAVNKYQGRLLLVSNLPYSIACPTMINLITGTDIIADAMYVTVQKEVAQRMTAKTDSDDYGSISILMAITGKTKLLRTLSPTVFWPQPEVDSAMISFVREPQKAMQIHNMDTLNEVIGLFMGHRRKMLKACTKLNQGRLTNIHNWTTIFSDCAIDPHLRPEQLTPENYLAIANLCSEFLGETHPK